jgi:hypothetical protein
MRLRTMISGFMLSVLLVHLSPAIADNWWYRKHVEGCPAGQRAPIIIADITLYIDLQWMDSLDFGEFRAPADPCQTLPFKAQRVTFYYPYKELERLYQDRRLPLTRLILKAGTADEIWRLPFPDFTGRRLAIGTNGFVEDVSDRAHLPQAHQRAYLFQHLTEGMSQEPFEVVCGGFSTGAPPGRRCDAHYFLEPGLILFYEFRQDGRDMAERYWDVPSSKPIQEPDGLLKLDRKVREFVQFLRAEP